MTTLFHHVSVPRPPGSQSAKQARAFYGDLLGLAEIAVPASLQHLDLVWFAVGAGELHLFSEDPRTDTSGRHFCLHVADQAAVRAHLEAAKVPCTDTIAIPGRPRFFTHDPFGNSIEITTIEDASAYNKGV
jgi:catechol 2,3-dioxygenase-like lactoylglutathione lyase family enzyme